jgi:hypothetical protein
MENDRALAEALNDCLDAIEAGQASVEDCLARYPQYADRLEDLLRLSNEVMTLSFPAPTSEMLAVGEQKLVQAVARPKAAQEGEEPKKRGPFDTVRAKLHTLPRWVVPAAALLASAAALFACVILAVIGGGLAWKGLPGTASVPASPPVVVSEDDRYVTPVPSPTAAKGVAQATPPLSSPTVQPVSPLPGPTLTPKGDDAQPTHTVFLPRITKPLSLHLAMLQETQGLVELQDVDGEWSITNDGQILRAGARVRTGALSGANVTFYDGSTAYLGPNTEISIDDLGQDPGDQSRIVELTQWVGETDHDVVPSHGANGRYEVHTPSGIGAAKGTSFHVSVTPALVVRFGVDEGSVTVTHLDVTVVVGAGQLTTVHVDRPPSQPAFRVTGEGEVEAVGATWRIAGQRFETYNATVIFGSPQVGDWVRVDGHLLADGTRVADRIVLLRRAPTSRFTISGEVEATGTISCTVAGQEIAVDEATEIDDGIQIGDWVRVDGVIDGPEDGTLLAETITLIDEQGVPFSFVGVVAEIAETYWMISGISVTVDAETVIDSDLVTGDVVRVRGVFLEEEGSSSWLARSIEAVVAKAFMFAFTGEVEATGAVTWTVAGQAIVVNNQTEIDHGIEVGDQVRVRGIIPESGAWLAESIHLVETPTLSFLFVGTVDEIAEGYWMISGVSVTVDAETVIDHGLAVGDVVRVRGRIMADGSRLARSIRRLVPQEQEFEFVGIVERIDPWVVSGISIKTRMWTEIRGEIEVGDLVNVEGRILPDGTWLAKEIKLADRDQGLSFEFVGRVKRIDPWVVSGISLAVNDRTEIVDEIEVGDRVKVEGRILPTGQWLATEIKLEDPRLGRGCTEFISVVVRVGTGQVVLQNGATIPIDAGVQIEGDIQVNSVISFYVCVDDEGQVTIVSIIVLYQKEPEVIVPPAPAPPSQPPSQTPAPGGAIVVSENNQTRTFTCNGHPVTINGNANNITLLGRCGPVTIRGNDNWVSIQAATSVTNTGNGNTIVGR